MRPATQSVKAVEWIESITILHANRAEIDRSERTGNHNIN